jgi:ATP-dependent helicase HepA
MNEFVGIVLFHKDYGYCKVLSVNEHNRTIEVQFCGTERYVTYALTSLGDNLQHKMLPLESEAIVEGRGVCKLVKIPPPGTKNDFFHYVVCFDETGDTAELDERTIIPLSANPKETLFSRMGSCDPHPLHKVIARRQFLLALEELHNETNGLESLISSRVELYPHQAFVAGNVINDSVRRFILADEVGLGKTIEAGLVISELLAAKPEAKVLILTPGALSRQWLCELHISFGAQDFRLVDLYSEPKLDKWKRVICSINRAVFSHREDFERLAIWDLVVVDEAHHLLWNPDAYQLVEKLSRASSGLLLLSAVPAREREDELLRLLRLLDPERYAVDKQVTQRFTELYRAQSQLGQGLRILDRDIVDLEKGKASPEDLDLPLNLIMSAPVISDDADLKKAGFGVLTMPREHALVEIRKIRDLIVTRYRLSRRIIKNRRSQLISQELLKGVSREYELLSYKPEGFEMEARLAIERILEEVMKSDSSVTTKRTLFKIAYSSMSDPVCASLLANELLSGIEKRGHVRTSGLLATSYNASYDEYYDLLEDLSVAVSPQLDESLVRNFSDSVNAWIDTRNTNRRFDRLLACIPEMLAKSGKLIIFSGAYGSAMSLAGDLKERLGDDVVEVFTFNLTDNQKEQNVLRFRTNNKCLILVSDETGGEGRNFQFAGAIVHYDLPWSIAAIEQRVGRLDRIGRTSSVKSYLIYQANSIEAGFVSCLTDGFRVFTISISGLEFMLRDCEFAMIDIALTSDWERLASMSPQIAAEADRERITDDAEALTDAGSFPGFGRMRFMNEISNDLERRLEDGFVAYFRSLARQGSAHRYADVQDPNLQLWCLKPDEVRNEPLPNLRRDEDGLFSERRGTFHRLIAREHRNLEFFSIGNPLFDAVSSVALNRLSGRVFALRLCGLEADVGNYLTIGMRCVLDPNIVGNNVSLLRRGRQYFFDKYMYLIYRLNDTSILNAPSLEVLLKAAFDGTKPASDLMRQGFYQLVENESLDWSGYLMSMHPVALTDARKVYQEKFGSDHASLMLELRKERLELSCAPISIGRDVEALITLEHAFEEWQPVIDSIGVMQVSA